MRVNSMSKIDEVLYLLKHKKSQREIEKSLSISRNTIRKYKNLAHKYGFNTDSSSEEISAITLKVHDKVYIDAKDYTVAFCQYQFQIYLYSNPLSHM